MLANFMPQLVQALKFESHHTSFLAEMLLNRAIKSPRIVGHAYFWALNASLYDQYTFERLYLHYERFLFLTPHYRTELYFQSKINDAIIDTNYQAVNDKSASMEDLLDFVNQKLNEIMTELNVDYFILPHLPSVPLVKINKLKAMDSKLKPIYLNWTVQTKGNEQKSINALFKKGDDLRKDQVVIQIFKIFSQLCFEESLNLHMTPYEVLATGFKFGYLEFVSDCKDLVVVHKEYSPWWDCLFSTSIINNFKKIINKDQKDPKSQHIKFEEQFKELKETKFLLEGKLNSVDENDFTKQWK